MSRAVPFLLILLLAIPALAQSEGETPAPDYSPKALRFVFQDFTYVPPAEPYVGVRTRYAKFSGQWLPLMFLLPSPMGISGDHHSLAPSVDPFAQLGVSYPMTSKTWNDRTFARRVRKETDAYLRADREQQAKARTP